MQLKNPIKKSFFGEIFLFIALLIPNLASLFAESSWICEISTHFRVQYFIGACIISFMLMISKNWLLVFITLLIGIFNGYEVIKFSNNIKIEEPKLTLYHHNILLANKNLEEITDHIIDNNYDVAIIQEATPHLSQHIEKLRKKFPYIIDRAKYGAYGNIILSQHKITQQQIIPFNKNIQLGHNVIENEAITFSITHPEYDEDITIYTFHAVVGLSKETQIWRDQDLKDLSSIVSNNSSKYKILTGDWNITPYSPVFKQILDLSELEFYTSNIYSTPTWPSPLKYKIFQIPIDYILTSKNMKADISVLKNSMGSDHYPVIAKIK